MKVSRKKLSTGMISAILLVVFYLGTPGVARGEGSTLKAVWVEGKPYVSLLSLARVTGGTIAWLPGSQKLILQLSEERIVVTPGAAVIAVGRSSVRIPVAPRWVEGSVFVPVKWFLPIVEPLCGREIRVDVPGWKGKRDSDGKPKGADKVRRTGKGREKARDSGKVKNEKEPAHKADRPDGREEDRQVSRGEQRSTKGKTGLPKPRRRVASGMADGREPWIIHTVIIDPGHGGKDVGATGPTGLQEKKVALIVAHHLKKLIERRLHLRAVLTRSTDEFVPLDGRARFALENDGRMFISLHCNSTAKGIVRGTEIYFLSEAQTDEAREVARRENAALAFEGKDLTSDDSVLRQIFEGMSSDQYLKESQDLAAEIRSAVIEAGGRLKSRGVKQAGFYVMKGTQARMPSVLVEMAFISNPQEERLLRRDPFLRQIAKAIFEGIRKFKGKMEREVATN